uniref:Uncharacterized protein n=1 Tax=Cyprinus carpio TaxID=7962 RepID=A0A8C1LRM6_CYPCA
MNLSLLMVSYMNFDYLSLRCLQAVSKAAELLLNPDAPAIPSPGQAFGYEEDAQGVLHRHKPQPETRTGQTDYDSAPKPELLSSQKYQGVRQYDLQDQFETPSNPHAPGLSPPFLSQTQRFSPVKDETPPVGILKKGRGVKKNPFSLTAVCFLPENRPKATLGPGAYSVFEYGLAYESLKNACLESTRKGAFGSIAPCRLFLPSKKEMSRPGPTQYKVEKTTEALYKKQGTAAFKSATDRLVGSLFAKDTPLPGSYNMSESFEKIHGLHHYSKPRSKKARKRPRLPPL